MYTNQFCGRFVVSCPELIHYSESRPRFSNNIIESNRSKPPRRLTASIRCSQMILFLLESFTLPAIHTPSPHDSPKALAGGVNVLVPHRRPRTLKAGKCALGVWDVQIHMYVSMKTGVRTCILQMFLFQFRRAGTAYDRYKSSRSSYSGNGLIQDSVYINI